MRSNLSKKLEELREVKGWTKTEVSKRLGMKGMSTYANWEYGIRQPDNQMLEKLADLYNVTTDYLLGRSDRPRTQDDSSIESIKQKIANDFPDINLMFRDMESMTADDLQEVYDYIKFKKSQKKGDK